MRVNARIAGVTSPDGIRVWQSPTPTPRARVRAASDHRVHAEACDPAALLTWHSFQRAMVVRVGARYPPHCAPQHGCSLRSPWLTGVRDTHCQGQSTIIEPERAYVDDSCRGRSSKRHTHNANVPPAKWRRVGRGAPTGCAPLITAKSPWLASWRR